MRRWSISRPGDRAAGDWARAVSPGGTEIRWKSTNRYVRGSQLLLSALLAQLFARYAAVNSFVRTRTRLTQSQTEVVLAAETRHAGADMTPGAPDIADTDFLRSVAVQLETATMRFGRAGPRPARLGQIARQSFAVSDVARDAGGARRPAPQVAVNVLA